MKIILPFCFLFLLFVNCDDNEDSSIAALDCNEVACTEVFITLNVSVRDASGVAIPLDRFEVIDKGSSEDITIELDADSMQMAQESGNYPLYNDLFVDGNQNTKRTLVFKGYIDDDPVATAEYLIDTDCCHVDLESGEADIIIN